MSPQRLLRREAADSKTSRFSLTAPQMALWLDQALHPRKPIYNTGQLVTIGAAVDTDIFTKALARVVAENDALRLQFGQHGAEIFQEVIDDVIPKLDLRDFSGEADPAAAARPWLEELFWEPIIPTDFPLFRFALARLDARRFIWLQAYHHLIIDASGRQLIAARTAAIYDKLAADERPPRLGVGSYRQARAAQENYLASASYGEDERYWRRRFSDVPKPIIHREAGLSEKTRSGRPTRLEAGLTRDETMVLRAFARDCGTSVFKLMLAVAWSCFSRLYGKRDLVFGVPLANRAAPHAKGTVGLFSTVMPFRLHLDTATPLRAALKQLDQEFSADLKHCAFPTDHINRLLQLRRLNRGGLHDVVVNYVRNDYAFDLGGTRIACTNLSAGFAVPYSIMAMDYAADEAIRVVIDYDRGRIDPAEAAQLLKAFRGALSRVTQSDDLPIGLLVPESESPPVELGSGTEHPPASGRPKQSTGVAAPTAGGTPRDRVEATLLDIWKKYLPEEIVDVDADYFKLGGDSLRAVLLMGECNLRMGVELPLSVLFECRTVARVADAYRGSIMHEEPSCFVRLQEGRDGVPLLLVHPIAGSLLCYRDLITRLGSDRPVYGLQAAGLRDGERLPESMEEMADDYLRAAGSVVRPGPVHLAGWSFGGLVAFAMACRLAESGSPAATLTMVDTAARADFGSDQDDAAIARLVAKALAVDAELPADLDMATSIRRIAAATALHPGSTGMSVDQVARMIDLFRNARRLRRNYRAPRLKGRVTLIRASLETGAREADFDWSGLIDGQLEVIALPATHDSIVQPPHVDQLATLLSGVMAADRDGARP